MKRKLITLFIGCMTLNLLGCGNSGTLSSSTKQLTTNDTPDVSAQTEAPEAPADTAQPDPAQVTGNTESFSTRYLTFATDLLKQTYQPGKNEMLSPMSILAALTMTEIGARGDTLSQMEQVISNGVSVTQHGQELSAYMKNLPDTENAHLGIANSIWFKKSDTLHIEDDFLTKNTDLFHAEIYEAPFDDTTLKDINTWVSDKTEKMIPQILNKIDENSVMYLINAVAFDAKWQNPYEKSDVQNGIFTRENGTTEDVSMMYSTENFYLEDENTTGFIRPYEDGYQFVALLPDEGISMNDYIQELTEEKFADLIENASTKYDVYASIPKFDSEYAIELNDTLQNMGITDAFDETKADFTGIGTSDKGNLSISNVIHKTFISVDEQGTKAGAATLVGISECAAAIDNPSKMVYLDRPFVYAIIDSETNLAVFLGITDSVTD